MPKRAGAKSPGERRRPADCAFGDLVVFADGRCAQVTATIAGGTFGRWISCGRCSSELLELPDEPIRLLAG